jgi:hypothetical protein
MLTTSGLAAPLAPCAADGTADSGGPSCDDAEIGDPVRRSWRGGSMRRGFGGTACLLAGLRACWRTGGPRRQRPASLPTGPGGPQRRRPVARGGGYPRTGAALRYGGDDAAPGRAHDARDSGSAGSCAGSGRMQFGRPGYRPAARIPDASVGRGIQLAAIGWPARVPRGVRVADSDHVTGREDIARPVVRPIPAGSAQPAAWLRCQPLDDRIGARRAGCHRAAGACRYLHQDGNSS